MKIRTGFVSNSSSSSFLIYGTYFKNGSGEAEALDDWGSPHHKKISEAGFKTFNPYDEGVFVGMSWDKIEDNETGAQFKERVSKKLCEILDKPADCGTFSAAWHDG